MRVIVETTGHPAAAYATDKSELILTRRVVATYRSLRESLDEPFGRQARPTSCVAFLVRWTAGRMTVVAPCGSASGGTYMK